MLFESQFPLEILSACPFMKQDKLPNPLTTVCISKSSAMATDDHCHQMTATALNGWNGRLQRTLARLPGFYIHSSHPYLILPPFPVFLFLQATELHGRLGSRE